MKSEINNIFEIAYLITDAYSFIIYFIKQDSFPWPAQQLAGDKQIHAETQV